MNIFRWSLFHGTQFTAVCAATCSQSSRSVVIYSGLPSSIKQHVVCRRTATRCAALPACTYRTGAHSCRLSTVLRTNGQSFIAECTQGILGSLLRIEYEYTSNIVAQLSRKLGIFSAALYWTKRAAWNEVITVFVLREAMYFSPKRLSHFRP